MFMSSWIKSCRWLFFCFRPILCRNSGCRPKSAGSITCFYWDRVAPARTHVVVNLIFPVVLFIWPPEDGNETLRVVAAKNSQAKNISTSAVRATTLHAAACMRVQSLSNSDMSAGSKEEKLRTMWKSCRVLILEEISMVSALLYNMLDFRSMLGRRLSHCVDPQTYTRIGQCLWPGAYSLALGRLPAAASHRAAIASGRFDSER